jgi:hypothetical protein
LHEKAAPVGYEFASDISFTVKAHEIVVVEMYDKAIPASPWDKTGIAGTLGLLGGALVVLCAAALITALLYRRRLKAARADVLEAGAEEQGDVL